MVAAANVAVADLRGVTGLLAPVVVGMSVHAGPDRGRLGRRGRNLLLDGLGDRAWS
jgi:hypothetical protein